MIERVMSRAEYAAFIAKGLGGENDPLRIGIKRHSAIMSLIAELVPNDPAMVMAIGRLIDQLVGSVVVQHLEAAAQEPIKVPDVIRLMRAHVEAKIRGTKRPPEWVLDEINGKSHEGTDWRSNDRIQ